MMFQFLIGKVQQKYIFKRGVVMKNEKFQFLIGKVQRKESTEKRIIHTHSVSIPHR